MGKSRAEIQRAYRERLKQKNNLEYLRKERERKNRSYVPSAQLSDNDRNNRNRKNRENLRKFYRRKKELRAAIQSEPTTSGYESGESQPGPSQDRGRLPVRFNFQVSNGKRKGALKRWKRDISDAQSRIRVLEQEREKLLTKVKTTQRAYQRLRTKVNGNQSTENPDLTPRKRTERLMSGVKLNKQQRDRIRVPLLVGNALMDEISETRKKSRRCQKNTIHRIVSGRILKKYKCVRSVSARTGLCRHSLSRANSKAMQFKPLRRRSKVFKHRETVESFLRREDNSRTLPGKKDARHVRNGEKAQSHVLVDYLENLHTKFLSEYPEIKMSLSTFCRCRPVYILKASFTSRLSCLCTKHQNAALTMKAICKAGVKVHSNPEVMIKDKLDIETLKSDLDGDISLAQWTRVDVEEKGRKKQVTRIVETLVPKDKFIEHVEKQMEDFERHVDRMRTQYEQIRHLKQNLPDNDIIMQLDFAENYSCRSAEEVQSAYFNQTSVTLHPIVVYYKDESSALKHKSYIIVSDEMAHKASTVISFIDDIIPEVRKIKPMLKTIHYWSDSPSSQYRNRYIFNMVSNHHITYGVHAVWNYFESGHGKGPCDGLGGSCKRLADEAIRCGKVVIQDAPSFFEWSKKSSMKNVCFRFVSAGKCSEKSQLISELPLRPVSGTMKIHAVKGLGNDEILTRDVSCYCADCLEGNICTNTWVRCTTTKLQISNKVTAPPSNSLETLTCNTKVTTNEVSVQSDVQPENIQPEFQPEGVQSEEVQTYEVENFVAAIYDSKWYIGRIIDMDDREVQVDFMESKKCLYQWPRHKDIIWINKHDVICQIDTPVATGKSKRMYKLTDKTFDKINTLFTKG